MRPISKLLFSENGFEQFKSDVFVRITLHVEIDKSPELSRMAQERSQLGREMGNCIGWIGRTDLRIERRNFDRQIYNRKKLRILAQRIAPAFRFARELVQ